MKAKIALVGLFLYISVCVFAQGSKFGYDTQFAHNKCFDNWFIQFGVGAQTYVGDNDADADFKDRLSVAPAFAVGKWFSPVWGVRLKGQGGSAHGFEDDGLYMQHNRYYNVHIDAMWNLSNYWGVYSPDRLFNFTPYIGLGYARRLKRDDINVTPPASYIHNKSTNSTWQRHCSSMSVNPGIQFGFNLSKRINLDFDFGAQIVRDDFDGFVLNASYEGIVSATAGLTFKLGKTDFDVVALDYGLIDDLNAKINALRAENEQLAKRPVSCPQCPDVAPIVKEEINYVPNVVFFRLNSATVDANQKISVYNTAEFIKNTGEKIKVVGYADKKTGTSAYNLKLSEKRAKAVAKELTTKYNIPSEKIVVEWKGAAEQPYKENNWNRVVIMNAN